MKEQTAAEAIARAAVSGSSWARARPVPQALVEAFAGRAPRVWDVEVLHLLTLGAALLRRRGLQGHLRHNALFGPNVRAAVGSGLFDYTPCYLHEVPAMIRLAACPWTSR